MNFPSRIPGRLPCFELARSDNHESPQRFQDTSKLASPGSPVVPGDAGYGHHIGDPNCRQSLARKGPPADLTEKISKFSSQRVWLSHLLSLNLCPSGRTLAQLPCLGSFAPEESGARDLPRVGGDFVFPTQGPCQERLLLGCLTQLCSDTSCRHQGAWRGPQSSPLIKLPWLAELRVLGQPFGIMSRCLASPGASRNGLPKSQTGPSGGPGSKRGPGCLGQVPSPSRLSFLVFTLG